MFGQAVPDPQPQVPYAGSSITITSGSVPPGMAISHGIFNDDKNNYTLSGTPTATGVYSFSGYVTCLPDGTTTTIGTYTISVCTGHLNRKAAGRLARNARKHLVIGGSGSSSTTPINITTVALPNVVYGASYTVQMAASGGTAPYTWSVLAGSFPAGISMSSAGLISGSSTAAAGSYSVTLRCSDTSSQSTTKQFDFSMLAAASNVVFTIETGTAYNETNMLFVYDPAGYGYCAADGVAGGYYPAGYFPYPGTSMPLGGGVVYYHQYPANPVSPNGGYATAYRVETPYDQSVKWQSGSSPSGIYKFWCERTNGATMGALAFRYRIYVGGSLFWERSGSGTALYSSSRRYTQLWTYNTATGIVS
jgi:hypothetical protein